MHRIQVGLIGYGTVGSGVIQFLNRRKNFIKNRFHTEFVLKTLCDRSLQNKNTTGLEKTYLTSNFQEVLDDPKIDVVIELIGGMDIAKKIVAGALKRGKHVITANKELIANNGKELFQLAKKYTVQPHRILCSFPKREPSEPSGREICWATRDA